MTVDLFIESLEAIKFQMKYDYDCCESLKKIFNTKSLKGYNNSWLLNQLIKILKIEMNDEEDWIEYFIFELDFGKKYYNGCAKYLDGYPLDISNSEKLFYFLQKQKQKIELQCLSLN